MINSFFNVPKPKNEPVLNYKKNSPERKSVLNEYDKLFNTKIDIPLYIGDDKIFSKKRKKIFPPHNHKHELGSYSIAEKLDVKNAIKSCLKSKEKWENLSFENRSSIFLKAADLISGKYRFKINAATMLGQSKNIYQAEIDAACEFADFLRFNVLFASQIYSNQPIQSNGVINRLEYRALEGFIYSITPFNFTAIAGNLCAAPALMGNVIVWKPSDYQIYSANVIMEIFEEAGLPSGVINMISGDPNEISEIILSHKMFSGLHFTGSTEIFKILWKKISNNLTKYLNYPRIVGETGGKDFILAHKTAKIDELVTAIIRGGFEFQGQKCSAASRIYLPKSISKKVIEKLKDKLSELSIGSPNDMNNFITSVIHEKSFDKIVDYIENARKDKNANIIYGGTYDKSIGYFIKPTLILTENPNYITMREEIFGPVVSIFEYEDEDFNKTLDLVNNTSKYGLTGAICSQNRNIIKHATEILKNAAGNFYINDKPSGAVVGQQPFGGSRASGTNDKAGSYLNLLRWVSPRLIKETLNPPSNYKYPCMD